MRISSGERVRSLPSAPGIRAASFAGSDGEHGESRAFPSVSYRNRAHCQHSLLAAVHYAFHPIWLCCPVTGGCL